MSKFKNGMPVVISDVESLRDVVRVQSSVGNYNYSQYMHGMANGMILALSVIEGSDPEFLDAPADGYLEDREPPQIKLTDDSA